ncbi:restriction endonuclease subunit S [Thalassobacter stenotrophicus]|uniref:EcoKI restriction-modification system protein HsdS n=2 Tax=Thalassobacter stenotrophicus TaxID=266809 RepID=A0A0P1F0R3_9RHOB|nr:restriction endonuclease subunit S [Thalassobacter stenotrophicus]CUH60899.1 EcoKI restriction-modification system protein HsdS [Thalassobacter stenotrophicus]SHI51979.1 type I restriction enzyme, S subunit [Thalassobacter stenotrophicus DSM 16310]
MSDGVMLPLGAICRNASRRFVPPEDGKVWFINTGDVEGGRFTHNDLSDWDGLPGQAKKAVVEGDILYSEIRPGNGRYAFVEQQYPNAVVSTKFMVIEAGKSILPKYLYHVITSPELQNAMKLIAESRSGTFPQITFDSIAHLELMVPSKSEQLAVSSFLDAIEGRIRNNQKMNQTLEGIAKAIFKSWFVNFDPVRAKAEGRPTGLPPEICDLFPAELVDSEMGETPRGWEVKTISDLADCVGGATPSTKNPEFWEGGKHTWTSPKDLSDSKTIHLLKTDRKITEAGLKKISSGLLPVGTVLLSSRAPVGYLALTTEPTAINQGYIALKPKSRISNYFLLHWCETNLDEIKNRASGTTFAEISKAAFRPIPAIEPSNSAMQKFHQIVSPIYERVLVASKEMETLAELRDTLLPKLISGELRIPDVEKFLEEAGI